MILAGVDEAGYGPVLGPLVVGTCAFEIDGDADAPPPCVWKLLGKLVSKNRSKTGKKLHVNDSKIVYNSTLGLKELEKSVLALAAAMEGMPGDLEMLLRRVAPAVVSDMARYPWYRRQYQKQFPLEQDAIAVKLFGNALRAEMRQARAQCVHLSARVICEGELNRMFDATRNKSNVLFSVAAGHLDDLLRKFGHRGDLVIICDRQGGRGHYGPLLRLMFDTWDLEIISEVESRSEYRLIQKGKGVRIVFVEKAEVGCLPVAMASMLSKYLREAMMDRFNGYWREQLPGVAETAGYYGDGTRFIRDIAEKRKELGISDAELIRSR